MGLIRIETRGSFPPSEKTFSAQQFGHARAIADAIAYLSMTLLPAAIAQDHQLHTKGAKPALAFGEVRPNTGQQ